MINLKKIDHIAMIVNSIEGARDFYEEKMGFNHEGTATADVTGGTYCTVRNGDSVIEFVKVSNKSPLTEAGIDEVGLNHIAYQVDNLDETIDELKKMNCVLIPEEKVVIGDVKFIYAEMPSGEILEFMEIPEDYEYAYQA